MDSAIRWNLVVMYPDGREDVYPLVDGASTLGSDAGCEYSIQAGGVMPHHVIFTVSGESVSIANLGDGNSVLLNRVPVVERNVFGIRDELAIGSVTVRIRVSSAGDNPASTPTGIVNVEETVRRDMRTGWRKYRKVLGEMAPFISPEEAAAAEAVHRAGVGAFFRSFTVMAGLYLLGWAAQAWQCFFLGAALICLADYAALFSVLLLPLQHNVRFSGRCFALLWGTSRYWGVRPPEVFLRNAFLSHEGSIVQIAVLCFIGGWLADIGAGCLFRKKKWRFWADYCLLVFCVGCVCALSFSANRTFPGGAYWYLPQLIVAGTFPLWGRRIAGKRRGESPDVTFVAELATGRGVRTCIARILTVLVLGMPLVFLLGTVGVGERLDWNRAEADVFLAKDELDGPMALYWKARGKFVDPTDGIYRVPYNAVIEESGTPTPGRRGGGMDEESPNDDGNNALRKAQDTFRGGIRAIGSAYRAVVFLLDMGDSGQELTEERQKEFLDRMDVELNPFGNRLADLMGIIEVEATNGLAYSELEESLAPYRLGRPGSVDGAPYNLTFSLETVEKRGLFSFLADVKLYRAELDQKFDWVSRGTIRWIELVGYARIVPVLVLLCLGGIVLWKRGGDSAVGAWVGMLLVAPVFTLLSGDEFGLVGIIQYQLRNLAFQSPLGRIVAGCFDIVLWAGWTVALLVGVLGPGVLFVLLCWPDRPAGNGGIWKRNALFCAKVLVALAGHGVAFWALESVLSRTGIAIPEDASGFSVEVFRSCGLVVFGIVGAFARRKHRFDTEAPELGWEFFFGAICLETAIVMLVAGSAIGGGWWKPLSSLGGRVSLPGIVAGACALIGGVLVLRMCIRRNFLSIMEPHGFAMALFAFSIPILAEICQSVVARTLHGSFLQSDVGEQILCGATTILLLAPLWKALHNLLRRFSLRNLVRIEKEVGDALEDILDNPDGNDIRDEIFSQLKPLGLEQYAFYVRSRSGVFRLLVKNGWNGESADSFSASRYLLKRLGTVRRVIDLERLAHERGLFFHAFELHRIGGRVHAGCILPVCLGKSVRAVLATPEERNIETSSNNEAFLENVNTLGLAAVEALMKKP